LRKFDRKARGGFDLVVQWARRGTKKEAREGLRMMGQFLEVILKVAK